MAKAMQARKRLPLDERRAQLVTIARQVFLSEGLDGASMKKIAAAAGVNHSLLYRHFTSNVELFEVAVLEPLQKAISDQIGAAEVMLAQVSDPMEQFIELQVALHKLSLDTCETMGVILHSREFDGRELYRTRLEAVLAHWLQKTLRSLELTRHRSDIPMITTVMLGVHSIIALDARISGAERDPRTTAEQIGRFLYYGYAADPAS